MKKSLKIFLLLIGLLFILLISITTYALIVVSGIKLEEDKLINMERIVTYYDANGNKFAEESGGISITELDKIPEHVKNAFISIEDKRFYSHNGVDYHGLARAFFNNIKTFSFKEGASTITQQLIKNTHLSNDKTLRRKLAEIKLARELEKKYTKDEILEKYLNTIYFGNGCYGITSASKFYFDKTPMQLDLNEGATLASIIKAPTHYSPITNLEKCTTRKNLVLSEMQKQGYISKEECQKYKNTEIVINSKNTNSNFDFLSLARNEFNNIIKNWPYLYSNFKVYTSYDPSCQNIIDNCKITQPEFDNTCLLLDKNGKILAYNSTCNLSNRQPGSTLKPLLVYAPAIDTDTVYSCSPILDEKTDFNGYCPSNYNDNYYGYVSVKESLAKSLNTCAVKLLNSVGVEKSKSYIAKTDIKFDENDSSLCLALGSMFNGINLVDLTSAYTVFTNQGFFKSATCINKIVSENNETIYSSNLTPKKIFSEDTIDILNDMLLYTATNGTAKKLSYCNFPIYAKTGTVGNRNGNTDAYTISYTSDYILTSWCGNKNNKLMDNNVSGGNQPARQSLEIWKKLYSNNIPSEIPLSNNTCLEYIDKICYDESHIVKLADKNAPLRYKELVIFKKNKAPKMNSNLFTYPTTEKPKTIVLDNGIKLSLCLPQYYNAIIYKHVNNKKIAVYDTANNNRDYFIDYDVLPNTKYQYSIVPYFNNNKECFYGKEVYSDYIKFGKSDMDNWWKNELE